MSKIERCIIDKVLDAADIIIRVMQSGDKHK